MKNILFLNLAAVLLFALVGCTQKVAPAKSDADDIIVNEILVKLKPGVSPQMLEADFAQYKLKMKEKVAKVENTYIFTFNTEKIRTDKMLVTVSEHPGVAEANFTEVSEE